MHFLEFLRPLVSERELTFVSDRHKGIISAVSTVFPNDHHSFCLKHILTNLKHKYCGGKYLRKNMVSLLTNSAYAPTVELYDSIVAELRAAGGKRIDAFLAKLPLENYVNAHFKGRRYGEMTSNAAESFNSQILEYRDKPVVQLIDNIRVMLMEQMFNRSVSASKWTSELCPKMDAKYQRRFNNSRTWEVKQSGSNIFQVSSDPIMAVDIEMFTCSCGMWQHTGFPCVHAVCVLEKARNDPFDYVDDYYHTHTFREAYSRSIPAVSTFEIEAVVEGEFTVHPPITKIAPGRPRKNRIPSRGEVILKTIRCGRCNKLGYHNKKTCKAVI